MWDLIGNERAVAGVARSLAGASPPHAYLFVGPERTGKATLARRLAQALNCIAGGGGRAGALPYTETDAEGGVGAPPHGSSSSPLVAQGPSPEPAPCRECPQCRRIEAGIHADVFTVTVEEVEEGPQRKMITIDQVREIERAAALNPFEGRTRVVIIDPADEMTDAAQNAFLKTLEEPPPHVVFILVAAREDRLLPTVHSRCRRIEFTLLPVETVERALADQGIEPEQARLLARLSRGRPGWAIEAAGDPSRLDRRREALDACRAVPGMSVADRMDLAEKLSERFKEKRAPVMETLAAWQDWWRDVLLAQSGAEEGVGNIDMTDAMREDAARFRKADVLAFVRMLMDARQYLEANVQSRIVLDSLLLYAPREGARTRT